jgi:hypothetical protein
MALMQQLLTIREGFLKTPGIVDIALPYLAKNIFIKAITY